eukprot:g58783.t1
MLLWPLIHFGESSHAFGILETGRACMLSMKTPKIPKLPGSAPKDLAMLLGLLHDVRSRTVDADARESSGGANLEGLELPIARRFRRHTHGQRKRLLGL